MDLLLDHSTSSSEFSIQISLGLICSLLSLLSFLNISPISFPPSLPFLQTLGTRNKTWNEVDAKVHPAKDTTTLIICDEKGQGCLQVLPSLPPPPHTPPSTEQETKAIMVTVYG